MTKAYPYHKLNIDQGRAVQHCEKCYTGVHKAKYRPHLIKILGTQRNYKVIMNGERATLECMLLCETCGYERIACLLKEELLKIKEEDKLWETTTQHGQE